MEQPDWDNITIPRWILLWKRVQSRVMQRVPALAARDEARLRTIGPQHCDRCGRLLAEHAYLVQQTRWLFQTVETTRLCRQCIPQHWEEVRQSKSAPS